MHTLELWRSAAAAGPGQPADASAEWLASNTIDRRAVGGAEGGLGWLRVLRRGRQTARVRLRAAALPWRALHDHQHRTSMRLVQRQQQQRRSHWLAQAPAVRRAGHS